MTDRNSDREPGDYAGTVIAMGTRHGKERQVAPVFADELGARVVAPPGIDTDQFGTFAGEVPRILTPVAAAVAKARLAMGAARVPYGLASEASYDAWYGMLARHTETLVFLDDVRGLQIVESITTPGAPGLARLIGTPDEAVAAATRFGFPEQGAVVKATVGGRVQVFGKGITDAEALGSAADAATAAADDRHASLEPDLRAHHNPSRRHILSSLARRLARRLATRCRHCSAPGYGLMAVHSGLPCRMCGCPTPLIAADSHGCTACGYSETVERVGATAEPCFCPHCNP